MKGKSNLRGALALLLVLAAAGALYLAWLGEMPLSDPGEARYAASVSAMRAGGDWLVPTFEGAPQLQQPILTYWAVAASQALVGADELGARLPSVVSALLLILAVGLLVWRASGRASLGALAAAALAFSPLMVLTGRACLGEALLSLWTTLALLAWFLALESEEDRGGWWLAGWAALGLGFLTAGPVVLALVLPSAAIYALAQGRLGYALARARWLGGLLIFLAISLPWYVLVWWKLGDRFLEALAASLPGLDLGPGLAFYLPVLFLGAFPFAAAALPELGRALLQNPREQRELDRLSRLHLLAAICLLVILLVLGLNPVKHLSTVLPAMPFVAVLAACQLRRLALGEGGGRLARWVFWAGLWISGGLWVLTLAATPAALPLLWESILGSGLDSGPYALPLRSPMLVLWPLVAAFVAGAGMYLAAWAARRDRGGVLPWALGTGAALLCAALFLGLAPQAAQVLQTPAKRLALEVGRRAGEDARLLTYDLGKPSLVYYTGRSLPQFPAAQGPDLAQELAAAGPVYVFSRVALRERLTATPNFVVLDQGEGYLLGGNPAALAQWRGEAPPPVNREPVAPGVAPKDAPEATPPQAPQEELSPNPAPQENTAPSQERPKSEVETTL